MSSTTVTRGNSHETFYIQPTLAPSAVSAVTPATGVYTLQIVRLEGPAPVTAV